MKLKNVKKMVAVALAAITLAGSFADFTSISTAAEITEGTAVDALEYDDAVEETAPEETTEETTESIAEETEETSQLYSSAVDAVDVQDEDEESLEDDLLESELEDSIKNEINNGDTTAKTVRVYYSSNAVSVAASIDSHAATGTAGTDTDKGAYIDYSVSNDKTLIVIATALDNSTIKNAEFTEGKNTETLKASSASKSEFAITPTENSSVLTINSDESKKAVIAYGTTELQAKSGAYSISLGKSYTVKVEHGAAEYEAIKSVTAVVKNDKTKTNIASVIATISSDSNSVSVNVKKGSEYAGKSIVLTITDADGQAYNFLLKVVNNISSVSVAGVKTNSTIKVSAGTKKTYKVSVNSGAEISNLSASYSMSELTQNGVAVDAKSCSKVSYSNGTLVINAGYCDEKGTLTFSYNGNVVASYSLVIVDNFGKVSSPSVSIISTSDTGVSLKLSLPSSYKYENISSAVTSYYYLVYYNKADTSQTKKWAKVAITGNTQNYTLSLLDSSITTGNGYAASFVVSAAIGLNYVTTENDLAVFNNVSKYTKNINVSTKNPRYETKLTLVNKKTTLKPGQTNVVIAKAKFSKKTTYNTLRTVCVYDSNGELLSTADIEASLSSDKTEIIADCSKYCDTGKYTIVAYASEPEGALDVTASMTIYVKDDVNRATLTAPELVNKLPSKSATVKIKACYKAEGGRTASPKNFSYSIESDSAQIKEKVTVNSKGVVTIPSDYIVGLDSSDTFYVKATFTNQNGNKFTAKSNEITITYESLKSGYIMLYTDFSDSYKSGDTLLRNSYGYGVSVYDSQGNEVDSSFYKLSSSGCKIINRLVYINGNIDTISITASSTDGSNNKITATYKLKENKGKLSLFNIERESQLNESTKQINVYDTKAYFCILKNGYGLNGKESITVTCKTGKVVTQNNYMEEAGGTAYANASSSEKQFLKKIYSTRFDYYPNSESDVITVTDNSLEDGDPYKTVSYKVTNEVFARADSGLKLGSDTFTVYYDSLGYISNITTSVSGVDSEATYNIQLVEDDYMVAMTDKDILYGLCTLSIERELTSDTLTLGKSGARTAIKSAKYVSGTYKYWLNISKTVDDTTTNYKPIPITVIFKKAPKIEYEIKNNITVYMDDLRSRESLTKSVTNGIVKYYSTFNINTDGEYNDFYKYFGVDWTSGRVFTKYGKSTISKLDKKDLTGYIKYELTDLAGHEFYAKTMKITVKVE